MLFAFFSLFKLIIALIGIILTFWFFIIGSIKKDNRKLKKALIYFSFTALGLIILTIIEFIISTNRSL